MVVTNASADKLYYSQLLAMLTSLSINSPETKACVFLADYPEDKVKFLKRRFPNYIFESRSLKRIDSRGFSFIQFRADNLIECLEKYNKPVAWVDTDVIIRSGLEEFIDVTPKQLKILYRGDHTTDKVKFNAGVFSIGCSEETKFFLADWKERITKNAKWGMGQLELWRAYQDNKSSIELYKMSNTYNDLGGEDRPDAFADTSVIWHSKKGHFFHPKFQGEFQHYLREAAGI